MSTKDLKSWLEDMAALHGLSDHPAFEAAFSAARTKALTAASEYVQAAGKPSHKDMRAWLADMAMLKPWVAADSDDGGPFVEAFQVARERAIACAEAYAQSIEKA